MDNPFHFIPGIDLSPVNTSGSASIKGRQPLLEYDFNLTEIYPTIPSLPPDTAYIKISQELSKLDRILCDLRAPLALPTADNHERALTYTLSLLNPRKNSIDSIISSGFAESQEDTTLIVPTNVYPFPLRLASPSKLIHTLNWIDANIKINIELIALPLKLDKSDIPPIVEVALNLYCYFIKQDEYRLASTIGFNQSMFIQDRIIHLIFGDRIYWTANHFLKQSSISNRIACEILRNLGQIDPLQLSALAVAMGVIWTSRQDLQSLYEDNRNPVIDDLATTLYDLCANWGIDDRLKMLQEIERNPKSHILIILDDNGESVFDIALFQMLLKHHPEANLTIAVNRFPVSTNLTLQSLSEIISHDLFSDLRQLLNEGRVELIEERQLFPAFELDWCTPAMQIALNEADIVYIKGVNFFEVFQPVTRARYHAFVVSGQMSALLTGCNEGENILAGIPANNFAYQYKHSNDIVSLRYLHNNVF